MSRIRELFCFECYEQTEHSVLKRNIPIVKGNIRVRASAICTVCKTEQEIETSKDGWNALVENRTWKV